MRNAAKNLSLFQEYIRFFRLNYVFFEACWKHPSRLLIDRSTTPNVCILPFLTLSLNELFVKSLNDHVFDLTERFHHLLLKIILMHIIIPYGVHFPKRRDKVMNIFLTRSISLYFLL